MSFKGAVRATRPTDWRRHNGANTDEISGAAPTGGAATVTYTTGGIAGDTQPGAMRVTSGYLQYGSAWVVNNQLPFTMALLFKCDNPGWSGATSTSILCGGDYNGASNGGSYIGSYMGISSSNHMVFAFGRPNLSNYYFASSTGDVTDGNWHLAIMTSDGANNPTLVSWLDGTVIDTNLLTATLVRLGNNSATNLLSLGADIGGSNPTLHPVFYDEFIVWNRVLSTGEMNMLLDEVSRGYAPGTYQEPLAPRYNYDQDGTTVTYFDGAGSGPNPLSSGQITQLVDEDPTAFTKAANLNAFGTNHFDLVFPIAMDIYDVNYYGSFGASGIASVQQSSDGTTFSAVPSGMVNTSARTYAMTTALPASNVKALRFNFSTPGTTTNPVSFGLLHLYGLPYITAAPQAVTLWHPTADVPLPGGGVDFGDVGPTTVRDRQFRLKNLHGSLTASGTLLSLAALTDVSPSLTTEYQFSVGGGSFGSTGSVGNISPGAISPIITMRRIGASGAPAGTHAIQVDIAATFV